MAATLSPLGQGTALSSFRLLSIAALRIASTIRMCPGLSPAVPLTCLSWRPGPHVASKTSGPATRALQLPPAHPHVAPVTLHTVTSSEPSLVPPPPTCLPHPGWLFFTSLITPNTLVTFCYSSADHETPCSMKAGTCPLPVCRSGAEPGSLGLMSEWLGSRPTLTACPGRESPGALGSVDRSGTEKGLAPTVGNLLPASLFSLSAQRMGFNGPGVLATTFPSERAGSPGPTSEALRSPCLLRRLQLLSFWSVLQAGM